MRLPPVLLVLLFGSRFFLFLALCHTACFGLRGKGNTFEIEKAKKLRRKVPQKGTMGYYGVLWGTPEKNEFVTSMLFDNSALS